MYLYSSRNEAEELGVINITSVRIDYNRELEKMLQVWKWKRKNKKTDFFSL